MKQGKSRASPAGASLPKALLPDPDALLHYIDRAVASTEYARASLFLANLPPGPQIFNAQCPDRATGGASAKIETAHGRKAESRLPSSSVEDFLHKVTMGREGREGWKPLVTPMPIKLGPQDRSQFEAVVVSKNYNSLDSSKTGTRLELVDFLPDRFRPQPSRTGPLFEMTTNMRRGRVVMPPSTFSTIQPVRSDTRIHMQPTGDDLMTEGGIDQRRQDNFRSFLNTTECGPRISTVKEPNGRQQAGPQLDNDRKYDAAAADQAYRAGSAAMEEGDMVQAIALLRLASIKCPRNRPSAFHKIEKLITAATHELEMQEASRNVTERMVTADKDLESSKAAGLGYQMPLKVLAVGDMLKADEAYRAGVAALEAGEPAQALQHLQMATLACPEERKTAAFKIQTLIEQANFELRMR